MRRLTLHDAYEEMIPLIADDLRAARIGLGLTLSNAAERAGVDLALYRDFEEGRIVEDPEYANQMRLAARRLGMKELRVAYVEEMDHFIKVDLATDGPITIFVDTLRLDVDELKHQTVALAPHIVLNLVNRIGFYKVLASKLLIDKQLIELWVAAAFTAGINQEFYYYVELARDDPPDVKVVMVDGVLWNLSEISVEVTRHGGYSRDLLDIIGKKLHKRYADRTVLAVLVEQVEDISVTDITTLMRRLNLCRQELCIIGGASTPGRLVVITWNAVTNPDPSIIEIDVQEVDLETDRRGYSGYEGIIYRTQESQVIPRVPLFVKNVELSYSRTIENTH